MKKSRFTEEQILAFALRQAEDGYAGTRSVPEDGDQRADVLSLEAEVCGDGRGRSASAQAAGRRES